MDEKNVKFEDLLDNLNIDADDLPVEIQNKIDLFEDAWDDYEEADDEDESTLAELEARIEAMDNGICSDIKDYANKLKTQQSQQQPNMGNGGQPTAPSSDDDNKPAEKKDYLYW
jgi:SMC interacting uncharacterized protein involved in chromosome segregation